MAAKSLVNKSLLACSRCGINVCPPSPGQHRDYHLLSGRGAWTLDTNIPSPFTLTFYRVATWKLFYLPPFTLTLYGVTTWKLFYLPPFTLTFHRYHTVTFYTHTEWPPGYEYVTFLHFHYLGCFCTLHSNNIWSFCISEQFGDVLLT